MNGDPKVKRFENYELLRQNGDIQVSDAEMEKLLANEAERKSFHQYIGNQYGNAGSFEEWEAAWFPEYSKKKDYGAGSEPSSVSSSETEPTPAASAAGVMGQQATPKGILEAQGVSFVTPPQPVQKEVETPEMLEGMELGVMPESTVTRDIAQMAQFNDIILERQQNYIKAIENVPASVLSDPARAFDLLVTDEAARKLHNDPNASDYIKGQIKARTITDAMDLVSARLSLVEQGLDEAKLDRYSNTKSALIQIYESGDPNMVIDGMNGAEWSQEWDYMLQSNDDLYEYDALNRAMYSLGKSYENIKGVNPAYFKEIEKQRNNQIVGDIYFRATSGGILKYPRLVGIAATNEVKSAIQGFVGFVGAVGNSFGNSAERYNWADKWAEKAARMDWGFQNSMPTFAQRDLFTNTAKVGNYQVDVTSTGDVAAVRDSQGYLVVDNDVRNQVVEQYESAPDKYSATFRPHLAPAVSVAVQGAVQVAMTSKFAGLGRTAAAAKGYAAGLLTARFSGQNYLQALEEFGPENADVAARFAISTAALQAGISMYVNPLEIKLNPRFNVSPKTLKAVAKDLAAGKSKEAAIRNGFRAYSSDIAKGMLQYTKEVGKEGLEGLMEYGVDVGGRMVVRTMTDINAEYDLSANAAANAFVSELIGASLAAGATVDTRAAWQKESMLIAYENRAEILPMVEKMHGAEVAAKLKLALDTADKRMRGQKLTREQKNEVVVQEYNKTVKIDEEEAAPTSATQPEPAVQTPAEPEAQPVVETTQEVAPLPTIYDVAREEAVALRLEAGDSYKGSDGTPYTVVDEGDQTVTLRNEDNGHTFSRNKEELRKEIMTLFNQTYTTAFPEMDFRQIASIRRGMFDQASQGVLALPSPTAVAPAVQPKTMIEDAEVVPQAQPVTPIQTEQQTIAPEAQAPALAPAPTTETQAAPAEPQVAAETVPPVAPLVYNRSNIEQAEGIDTTAIATALDVVSEIVPDMQVQVFETQAEMEAMVGQRGNAFVSQDGKTIYISKESNAIDVQHEVIHPIMVAAELRNPGTIELFYDQIMNKLPERVRDDLEVFQLGYSEKSRQEQREEVVVEFLARLASGQYEMTVFKQEGVLDAIIGWFDAIFVKLGLTNPPNNLTDIKAFSRKIVEAFRTRAAIAFDTEVEAEMKGDTEVESEGLKARFTQDSLDPQYFRAKKWMRDEMNQDLPPLRDTVIQHAMGIFGINRGQAEIMYDVLWRSPDRKRMLIPPGVQTNRTGLAGALDKAQQWRNEWLLKSQGMPMEVLRGLEGALGENELLVRRMMQSYGRIMKIIDSHKNKDERRDLRETANRFLDGRITDAQIASLPSPLYAELRQMRAWIDEVSAEILNDANMSEMRTEIISANMGEYVGRFFRVHLFGKYSPEKASIKKFMDEYRRRNYEAVSIANPTWTADQIEAELRRKGEQAYKDLLEKHKIDTKTGGQRSSKVSKPTGMMKEREQIPKRAGDLWEAIDEQRWGPMTLPPAPGPVSNTGNPEFEAAFNAAWNDMRQYRLREAYFKHPQISSQFTAMEKAGVKLTQLLNSMGLVAPGTTPFSKENIRMAVENGTPMTVPPLPPTATPTQVSEYNKQVAIINDGVTEIADRVRDRVNLDMDSIMANKNELDGTDGFRDLQHLTPGVRAILGEIPPLEATVLTMANMARYYTMNKYYRMIRALGEGNFLFRADDPNRPTWVNKRIPGREQAVGMVPPDATTEKMAPLSGLYTTPEIYDILMNVDTFNSVVDSAFGMRPLYQFTGKVQEFKTIFSPQTQSRNFLSNTIFVVRNGWADPFRTAFALAYVPADMLLLRFTGKRLSHQEVGKLAPLKRMSDAFMYSMSQNFGNPVWFGKWSKAVAGSNISRKLKANKYGFNPTVASDLSNFQNAQRDMLAGMKKQETRAALVNDAVTNYGMSEDNARRLYADLQPKTFQDEMSDVLNKLAANGVLGTNLNMRIINEYMGNVDTADKAVAYVTNHLIYEDASYFHRKGQQALKLRNNINKFFADAYSFGDDTFKIFGYLQERADYSNLLFGKEYFLLSEQQQAEVDAIAMENVKNIIPNYDRIGKLGKYFSRSLIFAQFIAFKIESMRTWMNLFLLAKKEIMDGKKSGNAAMVKHGYTRLASHVGMTLTTKAIQVSLAYGLGNSIRQILGDYILIGMDDEDDEEKQATLRDPLPDYMKNDMLAASQPDNGKVTYISVSANHPFGDFQRMMNELAISDAGNIYTQPSEMQVAALAAREMVEQFWGVKIGPNVLIEMFTNKDNYGRPIYVEATKDSPGDDFGVWIRKLASYAARRAGPGYISQLQRLGALDVLFNALGLPENELLADFRKPVHAADWEYELLAMTSGYKPMTIDFYDQFKRRVGDFANYPGAQDQIYGKVQHWNLRIDDATFEEQIKRMVEEEYYTLASLHDAYRLPVKHGIVEASKMDEILTNKRDQGGVALSGNLYNSDGSINNNGRLAHMISRGVYVAPWDKISDLVAKRKAKKPDYVNTPELDQWIRNFQMEKQQDENR